VQSPSSGIALFELSKVTVVKIYITTAPTCFGTVTPSSGSVLFELAKVTVVKIIN
jgi:hypothetical protein